MIYKLGNFADLEALPPIDSESKHIVQQRLGHSDVNITLNTYTHVLPEMDVDAAEKLDQILLKKA